MDREQLESIRLSKFKEKDTELFPKYVQRIKGNMSAVEFARKLDVNPSTVSRLLNENYKSTVSESLVKSLAALITPEMEISYEMLFAANGMRASDPRDILRSRMAYRNDLEKAVTTVLLTAIENKSEKYSRFSGNKRLILKGDYIAFPDLILEVDEVLDEELPQNKMWAFDYLCSTLSPHDGKHSYRQTLMRIYQRIAMMNLEHMQYDKESYKDDYQYHDVPIKYSIVLNDRDEYEAVIQSLNDMKTSMTTSIILVNVAEGEVEKEYVLQDLNGYKKDVFFGDYTFNQTIENEVSKEDIINFLEEELQLSLESEVNN